MKIIKGIPIFLSADNNYAPFVATTIASICDNTDSFCEFYILDGGISNENKEKIQQLNFKNYKCFFIKVNIEKYISTESYSNTSKHVSLSTFNRFLIPNLTNKKRGIYLDVDIIANIDIRELWDNTLNLFLLGAVREPGDKINLAKLNTDINLPPNNIYFNAGVLLLDLENWKTKNIPDMLFNIYSKQINLKYADQDVLNICFKNNYKLLDDKFNRVYPTEGDYVLHYTGAIKPWHLNPDNCNFEEIQLFWKYAQMTPFYDELYSKTLDESEQQQKYMLYRIQKMSKSRFYGK